MIIFGVCVGDLERFRTTALPGLHAAMSQVDVLITENGVDGICSAYNRIIDTARSRPDCEAVVLLHEDVELLDRNCRAKILIAAAQPNVGVVGVVGGRSLTSAEWWKARFRAGRVFESRGLINFGAGDDVDVVDGLFIVLTPRILPEAYFDEEGLPNFHGYDVDFCLRAREAGFRVVISDIEVLHRTKGGFGDYGQFQEASALLTERWPQYIVPHTVIERVLGVWTRFGRSVRRRVGATLNRVRRSTQAIRGGKSVVARQTELVGDAVVECPVCQASWSAPTPITPAITVCCDCGTGITVPAPEVDVSTDELFTNLYAGNRLARRKTWLAEASERLSWVQLYQPDGLLLDVGCATGEFVEVAARAGYESYGLETSTWAAEVASRFATNITTGFLDDWRQQFPCLRADAVTLWHVLEHVPKPKDFLTEVRSVLHAEGLLLGEIPNFGSSIAQSDIQGWKDATLSDHYFHYTPASLRRLLEQGGFHVELILPITKRSYVTPHEWLKMRNEFALRHIVEPSRDFIRFIARSQ